MFVKRARSTTLPKKVEKEAWAHRKALAQVRNRGSSAERPVFIQAITLKI